MENKYKIGETDTRPWGNYKVIDVGTGYIVKQIEVNPGGILSLQRHAHRDEHWIITQGNAVVTLGEQKISLTRNQSIFIPKTEWHRIENVGSEPVVFIEVQTGDVLDESDIERKEDKYNR